MSTEAQTDSTIIITPQAHDAMREAQRAIIRAQQWMLSLEGHEFTGTPADEAELTRRRQLLHDMELSWYRGIESIMGLGAGGTVKLFRDGWACIYWQLMNAEGKVGLNGGLILHRDHNYSKPGEPITVGTWSVHT